MMISKKILFFFVSVSFVIIFFSIYFFFFYRLDSFSSWHTDVNFIGHGLYGIDSVDYTNSYEALELGYSNGITVMEADFLFTLDKKLVLLHSWEDDSLFERRVSYDEFMSSKLLNKYTPLDLSSLLFIMKKYSNLYIIIDTKEETNSDEYNMIDVYKEIVANCMEYDESLLDRFIVQLYDYKDYSTMSKVYPFSAYIFTIYKMNKFSIRQIVYFCLLHHIDTIALPLNYLVDGIVTTDDISFIKKKNIKVYVNTVNDFVTYQELLEIGIDGIYTDFLY